MKKTLRIIALTSGIISGVSLLILGYMYFEDSLSHLGNLVEKIKEKKTTVEE